MPLHDWNNPAGWDGVHDIWIVELLRWIRPQLPEGYRAYIGSTPALTVGAADEKPDVAVRQWLPEAPSDPAPQPEQDGEFALDTEVATLALDPHTAVYVAYQNRMVAALELVSPRNKDRRTARAFYLARYLGYLYEGAHLLLVDLHRRPLRFSFADALAGEMEIQQPSLPAPLAISYRIDPPGNGGERLVGIRRQALTVGTDLPEMRLALTMQTSIPIDLEATYRRAAADAYLS